MKKQFTSDFKKSCLVFKRWNRKGYSVFNTLSKIVKITTLTLSYSIVLLPLPVLSQTDTTVTKNLDLEEIVVSAQKAPVIYSQISRLVTTINEDEIKRMPVTNVNDLLENFSAVDIRQRGANGIQSDMSIRGGSFDQNLILLNGVNISDPQTGHHSLNLPVDLNSIERIEILEGSGSRIFGPNAFSGAINIITNDAQKNYVKANFTAGDFGLFSGNLSNSVKLGNTNHYFSFSKSQSNGYAKNTDYKKYNAFYHSSYDSPSGKVDFQIGYGDKEFGANSFYTPEYPNQFEQIKTTFTSLRFETGDQLKLIPILYFRRHQDRFELFRSDPESWYENHNYHLTDVYGVKLDARISSMYGITTFGAELRSENIWSNVLGNLTGDTIQAMNEPEGFYTRRYARTISNYFLEHSVSAGAFHISFGLLASWVSENNFDFNIYPGIDLGYALNSNLKLYATVNNSLRLPTFTDLFYNGPANIGNPNLKPEEAWSYEAGIKYSGKNIYSDVGYFYRDATNVIEWVRPLNATSTDKWETQNLTSVATHGITINNNFLIDHFTINNISVRYSFLNQDASADQNEFETKYSLNYLKHNLIISLNQSFLDRLSVAWVAKFQDRAGSYLNYDFSINEYIGEREFDPYWMFDAKIAYNFKYFSVFAEATNIFDVKYNDIGNIEMPGRWFKTGFNVQIGY